MHDLRTTLQTTQEDGVLSRARRAELEGGQLSLQEAATPLHRAVTHGASFGVGGKSGR
jgi:hypothetical protein